jgi:hypothetical protein
MIARSHMKVPLPSTLYQPTEIINFIITNDLEV